MSFTVYILKCADGSFYTGHTDNLETRIAQHQSGHFKGYTHDKRPVELKWSEYFQTRIEALEREKQIKDWSRKKKEALFVGDFAGVTAAAEASRGNISRRATSTALGDRSKQTEVKNKPAIILVRPQLGENIGKAARAMLNFGLTELRLVAPRDGWPNPKAGPAAAGADDVLEHAKFYETVGEATADCQHIYATTVRKRGVTKPVVTPDQAAQEIHSAIGKSAILFGPERSGLETDDVAVARKIITVPINPEFSSLNLAQAVILVAYEWSKGQTGLASPPSVDIEPPALQEELDGMIDHLTQILDARNYFYPPDRTPVTMRTLRNITTKAGWDSNEIRVLRGVLSAIEKRKKPE